MDEVRESISLLSFRAGPLQLGIAAEDIVHVDKMFDNDTIHIASLLGVDPTGSACRMIQLLRPFDAVDAPESLYFLADTPLDVLHCTLESLLPLPRGTSFQQWRPVMGFTRVQEKLVLILDIPSLFLTLADRYQKGLS
jgi:hypothetical protein